MRWKQLDGNIVEFSVKRVNEFGVNENNLSFAEKVLKFTLIEEKAKLWSMKNAKLEKCCIATKLTKK